jgi:hypothetical protein
MLLKMLAELVVDDEQLQVSAKRQSGHWWFRLVCVFGNLPGTQLRPIDPLPILSECQIQVT